MSLQLLLPGTLKLAFERAIPQQYRPLLADSVAYWVSIGLSRSLGILLAPILSRILLPSEYGVLDTITVFTAVLATLMSLSLESALVRYYHGTKIGRDRQELISTVVFTVVAVILIITGACSLHVGRISNVLLGTGDYSSTLLLSLYATAFQLLGSILLWVLRLERRMRQFLLCIALHVASTFLLTITLVVVLKQGVTGYFRAVLLASVIQCAVVLWMVRGSLSGVASCSVLARCLRFSLPLVPSVLLSSFLVFLSRYTLLRFYNLDEVAALAIATRICMMALFICVPFQMAWQQYAMSIMNRPDANIVYANVTRHAVCALGVIVFSTTCLAPEITLLVAGKQHSDAVNVLTILVGGIAAGQLYGLFAVAVIIAEKPSLLLWSALLGFGVFVLLSLLLVPAFGAIGSALTFVGSYFTQSASTYLLAQRVRTIEYRIRRVIIIFAMAVGVAMSLVVMNCGLKVRLVLLIISVVTTFAVLSIHRDVKAICRPG